MLANQREEAGEGSGWEEVGNQAAAKVGLDRLKVAFQVPIIGGTGQVGAAMVRALAAEPSCAEVVMVNRRTVPLTADPRVRQVTLDTADVRFPAEVTKLAQSVVAQGDPVYGASCVGGHFEPFFQMLVEIID